MLPLNLNTILLTAFIILLACTGVYAMRRTKSLEDFFLGGRNVGPWISAFSYGTSYFSAVIFIGFAGQFGWKFGWPAVSIGVGNAVFGALLAWIVLAKRTRRMTQNLGAMTMPDFFATRYAAPYLRPLAALIIFIFLVPYSASVYKGLGYLFEANFGISYEVALWLITGVAAIYLLLGGYLAMTLTDFIQGIIMLAGSLILVFVLVGKGGGFTHVLQNITEARVAHTNVSTFGWWTLASIVLMTSFAPWGLPQMIQKYYAIKNESVIFKAAIITTIFAGIIGCAAYFSGAMTHLYPDFLGGIAADSNFDKLVPIMLKGWLPKYLMALFLLLILSASLSTLSSLVLVSSSTVAIDFYKGCVNKDVSEGSAVTLMRIMSALFLITSCLIAHIESKFISDLMSLSWGAVGGAFLAPYLYGLYSKKVTKASALTGIIVGLGVQLVLIMLPKYFPVIPNLPSPMCSVISIIVPFGVMPIVSAFTEKVPQEVVEKAFQPPQE